MSSQITLAYREIQFVDVGAYTYTLLYKPQEMHSRPSMVNASEKALIQPVEVECKHYDG